MSKFLLATHVYPPAIDGGTKIIFKLGEYLQQQGHQILVLTSDCQSTDDFTHPYQKFNSQIGLPVYTLFHRSLKLFSPVISKGPIFKIIPFLKFIISARRFRPDFIIAGPMPTTIILYAHFLKKITGATLIISASFHPTDLEFHQPLLINSLKSADFIWTLTDFETNYLKTHFQISLSKMINLGSGVDKSFLKLKKHRNKNILFIGSFAAHKGLETLIDAFCLINPKVKLTLAGQPTLYSPVINHKINSLPQKIKSRIKVVPNFNSTDLSKIIDRHSLLISPSTQESFGLVLVEAWSRGVPVVAANIPSSSELVNLSSGGLLFQAGNPVDLATKINSLLKHPKVFGQNGYQYVKTHFTWDKIGNALWQKIS